MVKLPTDVRIKVDNVGKMPSGISHIADTQKMVTFLLPCYYYVCVVIILVLGVSSADGRALWVLTSDRPGFFS